MSNFDDLNILQPAIRYAFEDYLDGISDDSVWNNDIRTLLLNAYEAGWKERARRSSENRINDL